MDGDDVRVIERGDRLRFALEALPVGGIGGEDRRQQLQRHAAVQPQVLGGEDFPHPALAQGFADPVVADRLAGVHQSTDLSMAPSEVRPHNAIAAWNSLRRIPITFFTPSAPSTESPHRQGRPISTARAPSASALTTSVPRRTPPSISTGMRPATASTTPGSAVIVAGTVSRLRAPWFETTMPPAPWRTASAASSGERMPLRTTGIFANERIHSMPLQVSFGSKIAE